MNRTTAATLLALLLAGAVTGCGSSDDKPRPTATVTATKTATPAKAAADGWEACVQGVADSTEASPYPPECESLSTADYYRAVSEANRRNIAKAQQEIDAASEHGEAPHRSSGGTVVLSDPSGTIPA
jgi:hypothetical protein